MPRVAVLDLHIAASLSDNNLAPVGIVPHGRERAVPASPVVLRRRGAMMLNQISFTIVMLTNDSRFGTQCTIGFGHCSGLCDILNACPADDLFPRKIGRPCLLFMIQNRQVRQHRWLPSKQCVA
eukprot:6363478-Pyramimonas_sp.AAC.1